MQRIKTGIPGLDELIEGGFVKNKSILLEGTTGTGKTIFSVQFIHNGVTEYGENGVFITIGERKRHVLQYMNKFGWGLENLIKSNRLSIIDAMPTPKGPMGKSKFYIVNKPNIEFSTDSITELIQKEVKRIGASRVAIDSITALLSVSSDDFTHRHELLALSNLLEDLDATTIITSEIASDGYVSAHGIEEFVAHGLIKLAYPFVDGEYKRVLTVRKMRGTCHKKSVYLYEITNDGIVITSEAEYLDLSEGI